MPLARTHVAPALGVGAIVPHDPPRPSKKWWQRFQTPQGTRSRFTLAKAQHFIAYARTTSVSRHIAVALLYPVPGLLAGISLLFIPLQTPVLGILDNWGILVHLGLLNWFCMFGGLLQARAASRIDHKQLSTLSIFLVSIVGAAHCPSILLLMGYAWRFPVPFSVAVAPFNFLGFLTWSCVLLDRVGIVHLSHDVRTKLLQYVPALMLQISQLALYPAYSALFTTANEGQQIVLVLLFPCIKFVLKRLLFAASRNFNEFAREIAVCGVEISASLYQATIMQSTPSPLVAAFVVGVDVVLSVFEIKHYLDRKTFVPTAELLERATRIIEDPSKPIHDLELSRYGTRTRRLLASMKGTPSTRMLSRNQVGTASAAVSSHSVPSGLGGIDNDKIVVAQALELLQSAESILLVEYLEVIVPIMSTCLLLVAAQLPSARYNLVTKPFYEDHSQLGLAVASIFVYTSLQAVTLLGMLLAMRIRYRLSAVKLLAFVLETHGWSLQSKLMMWMPVTLSITIVHYGVDFTFKFDYSTWS